MSEVLASLKKKGGGITEKSLWTNNAPSAAYSSDTVTLSENLDNYDYVKVKFRRSTGASTEYEVWTIPTVSSDNKFLMNLAIRISNDFYARSVSHYVNNTILFGSTIKFFTSGSVSTANSYCIPLEVIGVKVN